MALYVPAHRRRRSMWIVAVLALTLGLGGGFVIGRATVPSVQDHVAGVQQDARTTSAALRVLANHIENKLPNDGAETTLHQAHDDLAKTFDQAPWVGSAARSRLTASLDALSAMQDKQGGAFATAAESLADQIDKTFGAS